MPSEAICHPLKKTDFIILYSQETLPLSDTFFSFPLTSPWSSVYPRLSSVSPGAGGVSQWGYIDLLPANLVDMGSAAACGLPAVTVGHWVDTWMPPAELYTMKCGKPHLPELMMVSTVWCWQTKILPQWKELDKCLENSVLAVPLLP